MFAVLFATPCLGVHYDGQGKAQDRGTFCKAQDR